MYYVVYDCNVCGREFTSNRGLVEHYVQSPQHHYCQSCDAHFGSRVALENHYSAAHYYCKICVRFLTAEHGLHEHNRQKHPLIHCVSCKRVFDSQHNRDVHLRTSEVHNGRTFTCPLAGCGRSFVSSSDVTLHCESGTCVSGITRKGLNKIVGSYDRQNVVTNPARLIGGSQPHAVETRATEHSWNGVAWECVLCHKTFRSIIALNAHLNSPAHEDKIYRCSTGLRGCGTEFKTLSGLFQHVERGVCGATTLQQVKAIVGGAVQEARMLTF